MKLDDYLIAFKNLKKHKEGLSKELMKVQLDKYARRELSSTEDTTFELLFDLYLTEGLHQGCIISRYQQNNCGRFYLNSNRNFDSYIFFHYILT